MPAILEWTAAVRQHVPGQSDKALSTITEWTYDDIDKMRPLLEKLVDAPAKNDYERGRRFSRLSPRDMEAIREALKLRGAMDPDMFRRRAAVLHSDAALLGPPPLDTQSNRSGRRVNINSFDGRFENLQYSNPHWDLAMDMLDALPASPRDPFVGSGTPQSARTSCNGASSPTRWCTSIGRARSSPPTRACSTARRGCTRRSGRRASRVSSASRRWPMACRFNGSRPRERRCGTPRNCYTARSKRIRRSWRRGSGSAGW